MKKIYLNNIETNYSVDEKGNIFSHNRNKLMKPRMNKFGYLWVRLRLGSTNNFKCKLVHTLVAEAFIGPALGLDVNHIDGNKQNNKLENLEYATRYENLLHSMSNKLRRLKISKEEVDFIKNSCENGILLSKKFNISTGMVSLIKNNKIRNHGI